MLIHYLHSTPTGGLLWIVIALLEFLTASAILRNALHKTEPAFALYIYFSLLADIVLMVVPPGEKYRTYTWLSTPISIVECLLIGACVADLYRRTLGPAISLPAWVPRHLGALLAIAVSLSAGLSVSFWPQYGNRAYRILMSTHNAAVMGLALALWVLIFLGVRIGHRLTPAVAQIAIGYILMLSVNAVSLLVGLATSQGISRPAMRTGQFFVILAFGWWSWKLWGKAPIPRRATSEEISTMLEYRRETMAAVESVGLEVRTKKCIPPQHLAKIER